MSLEVYIGIATPLIIFGFAAYYAFKDRKEKSGKQENKNVKVAH